MNLILFRPDEIKRPLPRTDPRAKHILTVLRRQPAQAMDVGLINGPFGKANISSVEDDVLHLHFTWGKTPRPPEPLELIIGMPRPQSARRILREATTLGATALNFVATEKSDPSYAGSRLWSSGEWRRHIIDAAQQAFDTHLPRVTFGRALTQTLDELPDATLRLALDNYEAAEPLRVGPAPGGSDRSMQLAVGPERGWGPGDRDALRARGFVLVHLGARVLRTEMAVTVALGLLKLAVS